MASSDPNLMKTEENKDQQQQHEKQKHPNKANSYENTKHIINDTIKHFNEFTNSMNEVCKYANLFASSLQSLEDVAMPEVIGSSTYLKVPKRKIFDTTEHLIETLDTLSTILKSYTEKIETEALDDFGHFIIQVICPSHDELKGVYEHNNLIIEEFRNGFYSLMNHFYVLSAELLEKFLICGDCNTPIGFTHQPSCNTKHEKTFMWRKWKIDDKFITHNMKCSFDDFIVPGRRNKIIKMISKTLAVPCQVRSREKTILPKAIKNSWPMRYSRSGGSFGSGRIKNRSALHRYKYRTYPVTIAHPPLFNPTIWTPIHEETEEMLKSYDIVSFAYQ